jgi:DnaJ-class molecular chaperone
MAYNKSAHINVVPHKDGSTTLGGANKQKTETRCSVCHGSGKRINFRVALGRDSLVPAYTDDICPACGGDGTVLDSGKDDHIHYEYDFPDSLLLWVWHKLTGK